MTSIEKDLEWPSRYEFNKPFRTVKVLNGKASEHLPTLSWDGPHIVWLDYTSQLDREVVRDCETVVRSADAGTILLLTVCAKAKVGTRLATLESNVGEELIADDLDEESLNGEWGFTFGQWDVVSRRLQIVGAARFPAVILRQFVHFWYRDGMRMQTIGWVLTTRDIEDAVSGSGIDQLEFSRAGADGFEIDLPPLTRKELQFLNSKLPVGTGKALRVDWIHPDAQDMYARLYRWYSMLATQSPAP